MQTGLNFELKQVKGTTKRMGSERAADQTKRASKEIFQLYSDTQKNKWKFVTDSTVLIESMLHQIK
jgi:zona occludens toxin (predicted ATPase)